MVEERGWSVKIFDRARDNREKKVDVAWRINDEGRYTGSTSELDWLTLVSGDKDYVPVIHDLVDGGHLVEVAFWDPARVIQRRRPRCTRLRSSRPTLLA